MEKPQILIIDDEPLYLDMLGEILKADYQVVVANSGDEALARIQSSSLPDLILLDIVMPGIDGYETCQRLKQTPATREIPVIFLTARDDIQAEAHGFTLGAVDYITKPVSPPTVKARIQTHLALRQAQLALQNQNKILEQRVEHRTESLRHLNAELVLVEERERRVIASELHDGPTQRLVLAKIKLSSLYKQVGNHDQQFDEIIENLNQTLVELRTLIVQLSPPALYELGLGPAVEWLAESILGNHNINYRVDSAENYLDLAEPSRVFLFQAIRELLINIVKHAGANRASVSINNDKDELIIEVRDDGIGIGLIATTIEAPERGGFGLFTLRERIHILGGQLQFESDKGTCVTLKVPLALED